MYIDNATNAACVGIACLLLCHLVFGVGSTVAVRASGERNSPIKGVF